MRSFLRGLGRTLFWSFDRGTWQYDAMVVAILVFVLLIPRRWFHDQPQVGPVPVGDVVLIAEDPQTHLRTYRMDAHLISAPRHTSELQREMHEALGKNVEELKGHTFQIVRFDPVRAADGSVAYYEIQVKP